ncbi:MAG TPA: (d)CMP kinase, partial [Bellilinea sp.]|nr:(d)CMP kinase [Bellilinea sp.]
MKKNTDTMIAIDGPAASGKSTLAEHLVKELGYLYLDTGVMYRAVTVAALNAGVDPNNEDAVSDLAEKVKIDIRPATIQDGRAADVLLDGEDITWSVRSQDVEANVSQVSAYKRVREVLTETQRKIAARGKIIMAGRDIGTVVLPDAKHKIYLDASVEERAKRRHNELVC